MSIIRTFLACGLTAIFSALPALATAQSADGNAGLQKQLESLYPLTKATADGTDIVTAGAVLVLQKDNLQMCRVNLPIPTHNYYKNGEVTQGGLMNVLNRMGNTALPGGEAPNTRRFVAGEKFWVTQVEIESDGVTFHLLSDPFQAVRYHAMLKFPVAKGQVPGAELLGTVSQVIKTDGADVPGAAETSADAAPQATQTKTIALGQTKDQVTQAFGAPTKIVQLGAKEIDYYPDMKVTFVKSLVTDVE